MNELANIYRGKSFSIGFTIPDEYDESRIEDLKVNIGTKVYQHTIVQGVIGVNLTSNDTAKMVGRQDVVLTIEDSSFGVQKLNCGYVYVSSTISKFQSESFSDVYDVMVMLSFYSESLAVDHVLFDYLKGKNAYEYAVEGGYEGTEEQYYLDLAKAAIAVPYAGADKDVDLGENGITLDDVSFNENPTGAIDALHLQYNPDEKTLEFGLADGGKLQMGKEMFDEYTNIDNVELKNGMIVSTAAIPGNRKGIKRTDFTSLTSIRSIVGMVTVGSIAVNGAGRVTTKGIINDLNTNGWAEGSQLWGNPSVLGGWSGNKPAKPQYAVQIGQVVVAHATVGSVELNIAKDVKFSDLADVNGATTLIDNADTIPKRDADGIIREISVANVKAALKADTDLLYEPLLGFTPENTANKGQANGYASLGADGLVPSNQLPSFVDDVLEFANLAAFPVTGEQGKIYVALDTNKTYRWSGSAYIYITSGAVDSVAGKTGVVTLVKADVGLGNVDNTSDANKPVSTLQAIAIAAKVGLTGNETIADVKTFTSLPKIPVLPIDNDDTASKQYADGVGNLTMTAAIAARDKSQQWAENPEDTEVEAGKYSAFHWAAKAEEEAVVAEEAAEAIISMVDAFELKSNKVTSLSASSTDDQYASAKFTYKAFDLLANSELEKLWALINMQARGNTIGKIDVQPQSYDTNQKLTTYTVGATGANYTTLASAYSAAVPGDVIEIIDDITSLSSRLTLTKGVDGSGKAIKIKGKDTKSKIILATTNSTGILHATSGASIEFENIIFEDTTGTIVTFYNHNNDTTGFIHFINCVINTSNYTLLNLLNTKEAIFDGVEFGRTTITLTYNSSVDQNARVVINNSVINNTNSNSRLIGAISVGGKYNLISITNSNIITDKSAIESTSVLNWDIRGNSIQSINGAAFRTGFEAGGSVITGFDEWNNSTNYSAGNNISYKGILYECLIDNINSAPDRDVNTDWRLAKTTTGVFSNNLIYRNTYVTSGHATFIGYGAYDFVIENNIFDNYWYNLVVKGHNNYIRYNGFARGPASSIAIFANDQREVKNNTVAGDGYITYGPQAYGCDGLINTVFDNNIIETSAVYAFKEEYSRWVNPPIIENKFFRNIYFGVNAINNVGGYELSVSNTEEFDQFKQIFGETGEYLDLEVSQLGDLIEDYFIPLSATAYKKLGNNSQSLGAVDVKKFI